VLIPTIASESKKQKTVKPFLKIFSGNKKPRFMHRGCKLIKSKTISPLHATPGADAGLSRGPDLSGLFHSTGCESIGV
jgi:hypothetical protein